VRLPLMVVTLTLCLAAPARATPITVEILGVVSGGSLSGFMGSQPPPPWWTPSTPPVAGSPFSFVFEFDPSLVNPSLPIATYALGQYLGTSPCIGCIEAALHPLSAAQISLYGGPIHNAQGIGFVSTLFVLTLHPGWQSGSFATMIETIAETGGAGGKVTSVSINSVRVSEPATALMLGLGAIVVAWRRKHRPTMT